MDYITKNRQTVVVLGAALAAIALIVGGTYFSKLGIAEPVNDQLEVTDEIVPTDFPKTNDSNPIVTLQTSVGNISFEMYIDKTPITAGNFIKLAQADFYDGTKFHRVIDNFMIQGGDPNSKGENADLYGRGGPGYTIEDEFISGLTNLRGTISMANIGQPNSGGSQFFINYTDNVGLDFDKQPLTSKHPVFGHVIDGMSVVDAIIKTPTNERDLPLEPITIEDVIVTYPEDVDTVGDESAAQTAAADRDTEAFESDYSQPED